MRIINEMSVKDMYLMLFYSACGKVSTRTERDEQVSNAYWLVSLMQGVNIGSVFLVVNAFYPGSFSTPLFFALFSTPLAFNYFFFLKTGTNKILKKVDELIKSGQLRGKSYAVKYVLLTMLFFAISGALNNPSVQSALGMN